MSEEQCKLLRELQIADFNVVEWNLYMYTHPADMEGRKTFKEVTAYARKLRKYYESLYGPITTLIPSSGETSCTPWPWQV